MAWSTVWSAVKTVGRAVGLVCVPIAFLDGVGRPGFVDGVSMEPTLQGGDARWWRNDIVWLNRWFSTPREGDVFVFISPRDPKVQLIKRVVAEPGEVVRWRDSTRFIVPLFHYWMKADNPHCALDSTVFGAVNQGLLVARATHIIWPPQRIGRIRSQTRHISKHPLTLDQLRAQSKTVQRQDQKLGSLPSYVLRSAWDGFNRGLVRNMKNPKEKKNESETEKLEAKLGQLQLDLARARLRNGRKEQHVQAVKQAFDKTIFGMQGDLSKAIDYCQTLRADLQTEQAEMEAQIKAKAEQLEQLRQQNQDAMERFRQLQESNLKLEQELRIRDRTFLQQLPQRLEHESNT